MYKLVVAMATILFSIFHIYFDHIDLLYVVNNLFCIYNHFTLLFYVKLPVDNFL
jgi:hypothetical protein